MGLVRFKTESMLVDLLIASMLERCKFSHGLKYFW